MSLISFKSHIHFLTVSLICMDTMVLDEAIDRIDEVKRDYALETGF